MSALSQRKPNGQHHDLLFEIVISIYLARLCYCVRTWSFLAIRGTFVRVHRYESEYVHIGIVSLGCEQSRCMFNQAVPDSLNLSLDWKERLLFVLIFHLLEWSDKIGSCVKTTRIFERNNV